MKRNLLFILFFICCFSSSAQDYFTLKGRQFYDEYGNPFYPVVMPYELILAHDNSYAPNLQPTEQDLNNHYFLSPNNPYGATDEFDCSDFASTCSLRIVNDFAKIKALGFNTIRFSSFLTAVWNPEPDRQNIHTEDKFYFVSQRACPDMNTCYNEFDYVEINKPQGGYGSDNGALKFVMQQWDEIISWAIDLDFKIVVEVALGVAKSWEAHPSDYFDLLAYYGNHFKDNHSLINYIIQSEPTYSDDYTISKSLICQLTTQWSDHLRQYDEYRHLISTAGDVKEVLNWDPNVIKADFFELHTYPEITPFEHSAPAQLNYSKYDAAINRYKSKLFWLRNNLSKPFTIGETSFAFGADPDANHPNDGDAGQEEQQQADYAEESFKSAADFGGSGYNWWHFQDWASPPGWNSGDGLGLLSNNCTPDEFNNNCHKIVTTFFQSVTNPPYVADPTNFSEPTDYFTPYHTRDFSDYYFGTNSIPYVTGTVTFRNNNGNTQAGIKIKDALIVAHTLRSVNPSTHVCANCPIDNVDYTFTDVNGNYSITPFDPDHTSSSGRQYIRWLEVSAAGASYAHDKEWGWGTNQAGLPDPVSNTDFSLYKVDLSAIDNLYGSLTVTTQNNIFKAFSTLTVSNDVTFAAGSFAELYAFDEVHLESDFHAASGSEIHIYNTPVTLDCQDILNATPYPNTGFRLTQNPPKDPFSLELVFRKVKPLIKIYPNPGTGNFNIEYNIDSATPRALKVIDLLGNIVYTNTFTGNAFKLNLSEVTRGIYILQINDEFQTNNGKIIIQ